MLPPAGAGELHQKNMRTDDRIFVTLPSFLQWKNTLEAGAVAASRMKPCCPPIFCMGGIGPSVAGFGPFKGSCKQSSCKSRIAVAASNNARMQRKLLCTAVLTGHRRR